MNLDVKRVHDPPAKTDGLRVLVDRLWARYATKADAHDHAQLVKQFLAGLG
ncbi:MAG: DUF488 family protein [Polyangiales bacterium]